MTTNENHANLQISDVIAVPAQRGWNVIAFAIEGRTRHTWLYTGRNCEAAICFEGNSFLQETLNAIRAVGSIDLVFWSHISSE